MNRLVLDASVALKWVVSEAGSDEAWRLRGQYTFLAPELFVVETADILWKKVRLRELTAREASVAHGILMMADIDIQPAAPSIRSALDLSFSLEHPVYDCTYLALAAAEGVAFVTADKRLAWRVSRAEHALKLPEVVLIGASVPG